MTCAECELLIGLFADGELKPERKATVSAHFAGCPACAAKLTAIRELGDAVRALPVPAVPADLWNCIAEQTPVSPIAGKIRPWRRVALLRVAAVAALVLVAIYTGWLAFGPGTPRGPSPAPALVDLAPILEKGIPVNFNAGGEFKFVAAPLDKAEQQVTFRVFDKPHLTDGFMAQQCRVGCCGMHAIVQTEYRRDQDHCVMFQYPRELPVTFGDATVESVAVGEKTVKVVQGKACWAASWQINGTAVTIIGPRDRAELLRMVAKVEQSLEGTKQ
ncbi:MAG: zf-HC2 domain-containing protein [Planctomycetes bacterium]|nr:zf-HC2 domain-containing protein [Planctomycetota bacterium]